MTHPAFTPNRTALSRWHPDYEGTFAQRPLREHALFQALIKPYLAHIDLRPMAR